MLFIENFNICICSWLGSLGLAAYVDNFHQQGLVNMYQLENFTLEVNIP